MSVLQVMKCCGKQFFTTVDIEDVVKGRFVCVSLCIATSWNVPCLMGLPSWPSG